MIHKESWYLEAEGLDSRMQLLIREVLEKRTPLEKSLGIASRSGSEDILISGLVKKDPELDFCSYLEEEALLMEKIYELAYKGKKDFVESLRGIQQDPSKYVDKSLAELYFIAYLKSLGVKRGYEADGILKHFKDDSYVGLYHHAPTGNFFDWDTLKDIQTASDMDWDYLARGNSDLTYPEMQQVASTWKDIHDSLPFPGGQR